jgi:hypothetical protein
LEKAFDCVNHDIPLLKFEFYGITNKANALIKPYLNDRCQRVLVDNKYSNTTSSGRGLVKQGFPQGSIPGLFFNTQVTFQTLYLIYLNWFSLADNTSIIVTNHSPTEFANDINKVFGNINDWFRINLPSLNFDKTCYMQFLAKNSYKINMNICYENKQIFNTYSTKFRGLFICSSLSRNDHIDKLFSK